MKALLIFVVLVLLVGLGLFARRSDERARADGSERSPGPAFEVHVDTPLLNRAPWEIPTAYLASGLLAEW